MRSILVIAGVFLVIGSLYWFSSPRPSALVTSPLLVDEAPMSPLPVHTSPRYAIATLALTSDYIIGSQALCFSIRRHKIPSDVVIVAYIPVDFEERGVYPHLLSCFDRIETLHPVKVSKGPSFYRFKEQYVKLRLWNQMQYDRIVYMDSDFYVAQLDPIVALLRSPALHFGAVKDFQAGQFREWWNGGFVVLTPNTTVCDDLLANVEPFIRDGRFDTEKAEQGYISAYFENMGYSLPTVFNLNLAILDQKPEIWKRYIDRVVAIHYTLEKPWSSQRRGEPFDRWHSLFK